MTEGTEVLNARDLYLDLLIGTISNSIYEDHNIQPGREAPYHGELRADGLDWPEKAHSMIGLKRLTNLRVLCTAAIRQSIPGDFVETGIWRGGACILMRGVLAAFAEAERRVFCCDSFEGLPPPDPAHYPADAGDMHHAFPQLAISLETVRDNFTRYGLLDERVVFVKGFFKDTLHHLQTDRIAVLRLDGDMYESTQQALDALYPKVTEGGFIIVDDYGAVPPCRQALEDFFAREGLAPELHEIDWTGVWWQKRSG